MSKRVVRLTYFATLAIAAALAIAQQDTTGGRGSRPAAKSQRRVDPNDGKVATAEEPDFTRFRVVTDEGILVVFDADEDWDGRDEPASQLAYWHDFATEQLFFFDQLLFDSGDVLQSVAAMQRDLDIDPALLLVEKPDLSPLPEPAAPGLWRPAIEADILAVMAGGQPASAEGSVSGEVYDSVCISCDAARPPSGSLPAPVRGIAAEDLIDNAQRGTNCCWGGGGCSPVMCPPNSTCSDGNPCTGPPDRLVCYASNCDSGSSACLPGTRLTGNICGPGTRCTEQRCQNGFCAAIPINGTCFSDGNDCTDDACVNGGCPYPAMPAGTGCSDRNECTNTDQCQGSTCVGTPLNSGSCDSDGIPCTRDVCRNGQCEHESTPCATADDCPQDNDPCTLSPTCQACGCSWPPKCDDDDPCSTDICHSQSGMCEFLDFGSPLPQNELCDTYGCEISMTGLPEMLLLNDDDDNGNGVADYLDAPPVDDENDDDLFEVTLTSSGCYPADGAGGIPSTSCPGHYSDLPDHWRTVAVPDTLRTYVNPDGDPYVWPGYAPEWPPPGTLYVGGGQSPSSCPQGWEFRLWYNDPPGYYCRWRSPTVAVIKIQSLTWEKANSSNDPPNQVDLENCPNNGGKRIFPDKLNPNDTNPNLRQKVTLVATITPAKAGVQVRFRIFDVDDPFDQLQGPNTGLPDPDPTQAGNQEIIADVNLIDANRTGPDNRPFGQTDPAFSGGATFNESTVLEDDGQGGMRAVARRTITVSMQPGNNYRAAATLLPNVLSGAQPQITQTTADDLSAATNANGKFIRSPDVPGYKCPVHWSPMLTVWRKLHIETDTMVRPTFIQNTVTMPWSNPRQGSAQTQVLVDVQDPFLGTMFTQDGQFVRGFVELQTVAGNMIVRNVIQNYVSSETKNTNPPDTLQINIPSCGNNQSGLSCLAGNVSGTALISDDDLVTEGLFASQTWGCDDLYSNPIASLAPPDLSLMTERYRLAYIEPVHDTQTSAVQGLASFVRNVDFEIDDGKILWDQALAARNLPVSTVTFWTAMVVSAWQAEELEDADPDIEDSVGQGVTKGISTHRGTLVSPNDTQTYSAIGLPYTGVSAIFKAVFGETNFLDYEKFTIVHEVGHSFGLDHGDGGAMCAIGDCQREPFTAISLKKLREYNQP